MIYDNDDLNSDVLGHTRKKLSEDLEQLVKSDPTYPINHDVNEPEWMNFLTEADRAKLRMDAVLGNYPNHLLPRLIQFLGKVGAVCVILPTYILYRYDAIPWILTPLPTIAILWTTYQDNVRYQQNHRDNVIRYLQEPIESLLEAPFLCKYSGIGGRAQASKQSFREKHAALLQTGEEFRGLE
jgi:hypothetical protein